MGDTRQTFYTYRNHSGMWPLNTGTMPGGETAYDYTAGLVDIIGGMGGYAELFQVDRYPSDYAVTGVHWVDLYTTVRRYGTPPRPMPTAEQLNVMIPREW
jgi:hypothetical protein